MAPRVVVAAVILATAVSCGLYTAIVGAVESGDEAAQAATAAAEQAESTMHQLEHFLVWIPIYLVGELRPVSKMGRGAMGKWKNRKNGKKKPA